MLPELLPNEKKADKSTAANRYKYLILFGEPGWDRTIDHLIKSHAFGCDSHGHERTFPA
jgi:hypothetical protein